LRALAVIVAALSAVVSVAGCASSGGAADDAGGAAATGTGAPVVAARVSAVPSAAATISDRDGRSHDLALGDTVQVDWYDQTMGRAHGELVAVLAVRRLPNPDDDGGPIEVGDDYGPYEWRYGIKVRLTSLDGRTARAPLAYQFLQLSDGTRRETSVGGIGDPRGPDPSRAGKSSTGWLYQYADQGFVPTEVVMPIGAGRIRWSLSR
jgi:hypothetical protein